MQWNSFTMTPRWGPDLNTVKRRCFQAGSQHSGMTELMVNENSSRPNIAGKSPIMSVFGTPNIRNIHSPLCYSSCSILFFLTYVWLFPVTFLSPTVVHINLLHSSCFFSRGREEKLLLLAEKEMDGNKACHNFSHASLQENEGNALSRCTWSQENTHTALFFSYRRSCFTFWLLLFDRLISWRPGDSSFTSSAISCNISLAEM